MPRDGVADDVVDALDPLTALPAWVKGEKRLSSMLPYVSLVTDRTIRTRGNELMQCIRLEGVNSTTSEDGHLDRIGGLLAGIVAQVGTEFSFYLHKVSKAVDVTLPSISGEGFSAAVDQRWRAHLGQSGLRDKTLTLTVLKRPEASSRLPFGLGASRARHVADTTRRLRKLDEVVGFLLSSFDELKPRLLAAGSGEFLGFLGSLNTGEEHPLFPRSRLGVIAEDVANILCACDPRDDAERAIAEARALALLARLDGDAKGFAAAARESDCGSKASGGHLGQLGPGDTVPEFEAALRTLAEGTVSLAPVLSRHGWHLIRLNAIAPGQVLPFDAVRPKIAQALEKAAWAQASRDFVETLAQSAKITGASLAPI